MELDVYQKKAAETAIYPGRSGALGLAYVSLGLSGEAGEVANKVKQILRDNNGRISREKRKEIISELGDVLWYVAMVADEINTDLSAIAELNLIKLYERSKKGALNGSGDAR